MFKSSIRTIVFTLSCFFSSVSWGVISQDPLFLVTQAEPRVLFAMSNDHQLFIKAYTDYTDLDGDGVIDTTYLDAFDYYGYFDSGKCYQYDSSDDRFEPDGSASGTNGHECTSSNQWSGNWLNWATMTRMDILRKVIYGGKRSVDTTSDTELERALLPDDVHAFAKVYDAGSSTTMNKFTPYNSETVITVCNVTFDSDSSERYSGKISTSSSPPLMQVVSGSYAQWAQSEVIQCGYGSGTRPSSSARLENPDLEVRVQVCKSGSEEANCKTYGSDTKPAGILQNYGEDTASTQMNFGLISGSYQKNKSGGVLRKNIVPFIGNGNYDDEVNTSTGIFNYLDSSLSASERSNYSKGIVHTLDATRIAGWDYDANTHKNSCNTPGKLSFTNGQCIDWGNPLSEIYMEGLRYLSGKTSPTPAFDATDTSYIPNLTTASWVDPMPSTEWCADMSVITISTGLNSFDTDELSNDISLNASTWTSSVGTHEGVSGSYIIGEGSITDDNQCTGKTLNDLDDAKGVCPEVPSLEGGYHIAGMSYYAHTNDIRSDRTDDQTVTTYGIALAESLPRFEIPVGSGTVTILPACEARNNSSTAWRICSMTDLKVHSLNSAGTSGDFDISWEDSTWGNDYDMDGIANISFCVGSECSPAVSSNQIQITSSLRQVNAGHQLRFGFVVTGTIADDVYLDVVKGSNFNYTTTPPYSSALDVKTLTQGTSTATLLENPLFYAAKYGAFNEKDNTGSPAPNLASEWDEDLDGLPDGYFKATDPSELFTALSEVIGDIVSRTSSASAVATNSTRLDTNSRIYQARFVSGSWYGQLLAYDIDDTTGAVGGSIWDSSQLIPTENNRNIFSYNDNTNAGIVFEYANLHSSQQAYLTSAELDYVRGDQTNEGTTYRTRVTVLGDIINSDPLFTSQGNFDYYELELSGGFATYDDYLEGTGVTEKGNREDILYVGANDGMLHAFLGTGDTATNCNPDATACEGEEVFAYIPKAVIPNLASLADLSYTHKLFVDGSPRHGDAYIDFDGSGDRWGTALVGTLGGGGKGIFALDISDPLNFTAADVLWDLDHNDLTELGYTFSQPSIVKLANGDWGAIFGNGYDSANGYAVLYIVNLETGSVIKSITLEDSTGTNGLSTPIAVDTDGDKVADKVYAGDLQGNLWAVDISASNPNSWASDYKQGSTPKPLYQACTDDPCTDPQPITSKPQVVNNDPGGLLVLFGTGKYFEVGDNTDTSQVQTFYAISDAGAQVDGRDDLVEQEILAEIDAATSGLNYNVRVTSEYSVDYTAKEGWYLDFDSASYPGERIVANPLVRNGRVIFPTLVPETDACSYGGTSWLMELDALNGARLSESPFDLDDDGSINTNDYVQYDSDGDGDIDENDEWVPVSGKQSTVGIIKTPGVISTGPQEVKYTSGSSGNIEVTTESGGDNSGRQSWIQIR